MKKFVWDTSAILNIKEPNADGYSPGYSLIKDLSDGWIPGPYQNIFPAIGAFELNASVSRKLRDGERMVREFYIIDENSIIYDINHDLIEKSSDIVTKDGFDTLRGADLIFACIAYLERAYLVTLDNHFQKVAQHIDVIDLNGSRKSPDYRKFFDDARNTI
jgi:predicted nucleic acid-binding protein